MKNLAVVAFGGNALIRGEQIGTFDEQEKNVFDTCSYLYKFIKEKDCNTIITHGNGPQVGNVLLQHEAGQNVFGVPKMPIDFCVAETQGSIAYLIEQQLYNIFKINNTKKNIVSIITQVFVDKNDAAFQNPTKPVGPFYSKEEADKLIQQNNWKFKEDPRQRGWRRVVPSPKPIDINNAQIIKKLADEGNIVVAVGGGGIPVYFDDDNKIIGIDAVIDKDLASALLANKVNADYFYILTDVPNVCINFHKPNEKKLHKVSASEIKKYLEEGHFAEGSMAPKIRAALNFIANGGKQTIITQAKYLTDSEAGTIITAD